MRVLIAALVLLTVFFGRGTNEAAAEAALPKDQSMTVQTNTNVAEFFGTGTTTVFPIGYKFNSGADLTVYLADEDTGLVSELELDSQYSVSGAGLDGGGAVTLFSAPTTSQRVVVVRTVALLQLTDFRNQGKFFAETHEDAFDLLTMIVQQLKTDSILAIRAHPSDRPPLSLPPAGTRAGKVMGFDDNGDPIAVLPESGSGTEVALDLASITLPNKGAGMVGYNPSLAYPADTIGNKIKNISAEVSAVKISSNENAEQIRISGRLQELSATRSLN